MINFKVEIYKNNQWLDYTENAVFPLKVANLLDEQLDEINLTLKQTDFEYIYPLTPVKITTTSKVESLYSQSDYERFKGQIETETTLEYNESTKQITETRIIEMVVASDNGIETPNGSKLYNHEIYLIELTKILEGFIGDNISFTNPLGNDYLKDQKDTYFTITQGGNKTPYYCSFLRTPSEPKLVVPALEDILREINNTTGTNISLTSRNGQEIIVKDYNGKEIEKHTCYSDISTGGTKLSVKVYKNGVLVSETLESDYVNYLLNGFTVDVPAGIYEITYKVSTGQDTTIVGTVSITENRLPLKKWTILDVINRTFDLVEPLRYGEKPRFRLDGVIYDDITGRAIGYEEGSLAEELDQIISPEFVFTKMHLREMLKQIGGYIHAEPRILRMEFDENNKQYFVVGFDKFGGKEYSNIKAENCVMAGIGVDINSYCTSLDSSAENLVNRLDWAQGVVYEPYEGGARSLRCETSTVRLEEDNSTFIATDRAIDKISRLSYVYGDKKADITAYLFESTDYRNLQSHTGTYPYSKAFALEYTLGEKNIRGLFYKQPDAISPIFKKYAIINILEACGVRDLPSAKDGYMKMTFEVEYLPIGEARIRTNKQVVVGGIPRTIAYNQTANLIETRHFGEHLKGTVERLGNVEKNYTYNLAFMHQVPRAGMKFDDNYYISAVNTEILPDHIKCTVGLSKDFNRISQYVGVNSEKRMWEVSERQSFKRDTVINEYVMITTDKTESSDSNSIFGIKTRELAKTFIPLNDSEKPELCTSVKIARYTKKGDMIAPNAIALPLNRASFGNSLTLSFKCEDNYSAGQKITYSGSDYDSFEQDKNKIKGWWGEYVPYCDYYGRFYWLGFKFEKPSNNEPNLLPQLEEETFNASNKFLYRKDSREVLDVTAELTFVTKDEDIIIGSALAKNCALINAKPQDVELLFFDKKLSKLQRESPSGGVEGRFTRYNYGITIETNTKYKSWALVTKSDTTTIQVETEDGEVKPQTIKTGGEILLAQNQPPNGQTLYFYFKKSIYN